MLCSEELDGLAGALEMVQLTPARTSTSSSSASTRPRRPSSGRKEEGLLPQALRPSRDRRTAGTSSPARQPAIDAVTKAVGFGYVRVPGPDGKLDQFAHASSIEVVTTDGHLAQYYLGVEYSPKDVLLGLIEASGNKIGSPVANILTYCYHYDPQTNKHSLRRGARGAAGRHDHGGRPGWLHVSDVPARPAARPGPRSGQRCRTAGRAEPARERQRVTMHIISPVLWQFLVKWLNASALFPSEASTIAPWVDALYFFLSA